MNGYLYRLSCLLYCLWALIHQIDINISHLQILGRLVNLQPLPIYTFSPTLMMVIKKNYHLLTAALLKRGVGGKK